MKTALVISGGGSKGAFAVGAIEVLLEKYDFDLIVGTSTGALIAPMVAIGDIEKLVDIYTSVRNEDIYRHNWRRFYKDAIYDTKPLEWLLRSIMFNDCGGKTARYEQLMQSKKRVLICAVSLQSRKVNYFSQFPTGPNVSGWGDGDGFVRAVLGSTNQPFLMPPQELLGQQWVDGGVREIAPMDIAVQLGVQRIISIINIPEKMPIEDTKFTNFLSIGARALGLMSDEVLLHDIMCVERRNKFLEYVSEVKGRVAEKYGVDEETLRSLFKVGDDGGFTVSEPIELSIVRPKSDFSVDGLDFDPCVMQRMRRLGQEAAKEVVND